MAVMRPDELGRIVAVDEFEAAARAKLTVMAYEYLASGAADEVTLRENRLAFERIRLLPRHLVDVSGIDTGCTLFGQVHPFPFARPTGYHKLFQPMENWRRCAGPMRAKLRSLPRFFRRGSRRDERRLRSSSGVPALSES